MPVNSDPARPPGQESASVTQPPGDPPPGSVPPDDAPPLDPAPRPRRRRRWYVRLLRGCFGVVAVAALGVLVLAALGVVILARGPVDLDFIAPQLQAALDAQVATTELRLGGATLQWDGARRTAEIRATDVLIADLDGEVIATLPSMAVHLSIDALLRGTLAAQSVDIDGASLRILAPGSAAPSGTASPAPDAPAAVGEFDVAELSAFISELLSPSPAAQSSGGNGTAAVRYLTQVNLRNSAIDFVAPDVGVAEVTATGWSARGVDIVMVREGRTARIDMVGQFSAGGLSSPLTARIARSAGGDISAALELSDTPPRLVLAMAQASLPALAANQPGIPADLPDLTGRVTVDLDAGFTWTTAAIDLVSPVTASAALAPADGGIAATLAFRGLDLSAVGEQIPAFAPLARFDGAINGDAEATLTAGWLPKSASVSLVGGPGQLRLPELYADSAPLSVAGFDIAITASDFVDGLPESVRINPLRIDLGGDANTTVSIEAHRDPDGVSYVADATAVDVRVDELARLWPSAIGRNAREWVVGNLQDGIADRATLSLSAIAPADAMFAIADIDLTGQIDFSGITTNYLRPMPPVRDTVGTARFTNAEFLIDVTGGQHEALVVEAAQIRITGLDTGDEVADIDLTIAGPAAAAMTLLDSEPLGYASDLGLDPAGVSGDQITNLALRVPLRKDVSLDDIEVAAAATLSAITITDGPFDKAISNGELSLEVDTSQLVAWGDISLGGIDLTGTWTENFTNDSSVATQYEVTGILTAGELASLGLDFTESLTGDIGVGVTYAILTDGTAVGAADVDLATARIDVRSIDLTKPLDMPATAEVQFVVENGVLSDVPAFTMVADDIIAEGAIRFAPPSDVSTTEQGRQIAQIGFTRLAYGANDVSAIIDFPVADASAPLDIQLSGARLDARQFLDLDAPPSGAAAPTPLTPQPAPGDEPTEQPFRLSILRDSPVSQVIVTDTLVVDGFWGQLRHDGDIVRDAVLHASLPPAAAAVRAASGDVTATVAPAAVDILIEDAGSSRRFDLSVANLGSLLSSLGLSQSVRDGAFRVDGVINDADGGIITGRALATDFRMIDAPLLGRVLTLPSLIGIANTLSGRGIAFNRGAFPFVLDDASLTINDGRLRGSQLGILVNGTVDRLGDTLDFRGEVAPATIINSMLNNVPIVGQVLTGGGEGVFAATYRIHGPIADPIVSVNPISVLAPGFIRNIVGGFSDEELAVEDPDPYPDPDSGVQ